MSVNGQFSMNGALQHLKIMDFISQSGFVFAYFSTKVDAPPPWDDHLWPHLLCISQDIPDPNVTQSNVSSTAQFNILKSSMAVLCKRDCLNFCDYVLTYSCFISRICRKNREKSPPYSEGISSLGFVLFCPTLCDPMNCSLPGSSVHGISQARTLEWVLVSSSRDQTCLSCVSCIGKWIVYH